MRRYLFQSFELVPAQRVLSRDGLPVHAEPKVFDFIVFLIENRDRVVSRDLAIATLWNGTAVSDSALSRLIKESRRVLEDTGEHQRCIRTFRARGVRFVADVQVIEDPGGLPFDHPERPGREDATALDPTSDASDTRQHAELVLLWVHPCRLETGMTLGRGSTVLGRDSSCHVVLPGSDTSRRHAELSNDGTLALIRDLGSRNGTYVNGQRVEQAPLAHGDVVRCGDWVAVVMDGLAARQHAQNAPDWVGLDAITADAFSRGPLLLSGETGVGKTCAAHGIHSRSGRSRLINVACSGVQPSFSIYAQLEEAREPVTLLLEEVGALPQSAQAELVRLLTEADTNHLRVLATSEVPLLELPHALGFRADLADLFLPRARVIPPLRTRPEEIPAWLRSFFKEQSGGVDLQCSAGAIERAMLHDWPFNLHEVRFVTRTLLMRHGMRGRLRTTDVHELLRSEVHENSATKAIEAWRAALRKHSGRLHAAARALKLSPSDGIRLVRDAAQNP